VNCGITRASLGVQSFVESELRRTGRRHNAQMVAAEIDMLRSTGIGAINIDLIAGLPGQTAGTWRESLAWIARLAPEHVSVYMLEIDEDSRLGKEVLAGGLRYGAADVPSEDEIAGFYEIAVEQLHAMGIPRYEISNFARPECESRHNLKYWRLEPYVGFGADAHSFDGRVRRQNPESIADYVAGAARIEEHPHPAEPFFVGLRLMSGIQPSGADWQRFDEPIQRFLDAGLLEKDNSILRLTSRGVLLSNEVFQEFLAA
jgi:oxygen-independent coproporphyrinogen-3 oxidase